MQEENGLHRESVPITQATAPRAANDTVTRSASEKLLILAIVLPAMLTVRREEKRAKLLQYAERVWNIAEGIDEERVAAAIAATREFFERMSMPTRLCDYGIGGDSIATLIGKLEEHGMTALGERGDVTPQVSRQVYQLAV